MLDFRHLALIFTAIAVTGSIWAMRKRYPKYAVATCMVGGLLGLLVFSLYSI